MRWINDLDVCAGKVVIAYWAGTMSEFLVEFETGQN
jgi:hypothetical protein